MHATYRPYTPDDMLRVRDMLVEDAMRPCFEYYPPSEPGPDAPMEIYLAIRPR